MCNSYSLPERFLESLEDSDTDALIQRRGAVEEAMKVVSGERNHELATQLVTHLEREILIRRACGINHRRAAA